MYPIMSIMTLQISEFEDSKDQKYSENRKLFFLQIKIVHNTLRAKLCQNNLIIKAAVLMFKQQ